MPFAATGRSKLHLTTAATSHSAKTTHVSAPIPACLLASVASPSTSSSQTRPAPSARTATAPLWRASITCLKSWPFHSVEQPWHPPGEEGAGPAGDFVPLQIAGQMRSPPPPLQPYPFGRLVADRGDEADKALLVSANRRSRPKREAE